jgi:hypothetical protein
MDNLRLSSSWGKVYREVTCPANKALHRSVKYRLMTSMQRKFRRAVRGRAVLLSAHLPSLWYKAADRPLHSLAASFVPILVRPSKRGATRILLAENVGDALAPVGSAVGCIN